VAVTCNNQATLIPGPGHHQNFAFRVPVTFKVRTRVPAGNKTDTSDYRENQIYGLLRILNPFIPA
jgi:hypothetical protein